MFIRITLSGLFIFLFAVTTVRGTTLYVPSVYPTIQSAIDASVHGDMVLVAPGTYYEHINFKGKFITVISEEGANETVIDGNELGTVVTCQSGENENSILDGFTITLGYAELGGGMYVFMSRPKVQNCWFLANTAKKRGGGMYNVESSPTVINCHFKVNNAMEMGAGICNEHSQPMITDCTFSNNANASYGAGMVNHKSTTILDHCTFNENTVDHSGGGIANHESDLTLLHCTFSKNSSDKYGGGIWDNTGDLTLSDCLFDKNTSNSGGGGICFDHSIVTMTDCLFSENYAYYGGGIELSWIIDATLTQCTFNSNEAVFGGGMYNSSCDVVVNKSSFHGNMAKYCGGAVYNSDSLLSSYSDCTFTDNSVTLADTDFEGGGGMLNKYSNTIVRGCVFIGNEISGTVAHGGGMCNQFCDPIVSSCIFFDNKAGSGGGISNYLFCNTKVTNCTFYKNIALANGGALHLENQCYLELSNSIMWSNDASFGPEIWIGDSATPSSMVISYSDVKGGQASVHVDSGCTFDWGPGMMDADPLFVDPFIGDMHLTAPSPCKDSGNNSAVSEPIDFEGDPRIAYGPVDMGADEFYTHLYYTGDATPGGSVELKFIDLPKASPVGFWIAFDALTTPIPGAYGDWWLLPPMVGPFSLPSIPSNGVYVLPGTIPASPSGSYTLYLQAIMGTPLKLSNLCTINVQ